MFEVPQQQQQQQQQVAGLLRTTDLTKAASAGGGGDDDEADMEMSRSVEGYRRWWCTHSRVCAGASPLSPCYRLAFCPVGTWCVSGTAGGAIDVWDTTTLKLRQHVAQEDSIVRLAFVPATPVRLWWRGFLLLQCVVGTGCSLALRVCVYV